MPATTKKEKTSKKEKKKQDLKPASNSGKYTSPLKGVDKTTKKLLKDIGKIPKMSTDDMEKYLQAIALGIIPDRFGMEPSLDTKVNAIKVLKDLQNSRGPEDSDQDEDMANDYLSSLRDALSQRKIDGVDD